MNQRREVAASNFGAQNFGNPDEQTIAHKLSQQLGPEFISQRAGPGGSKVSYLEGWKATQIANDIFGFNGWASTVIDMTVDFVDIDSGRVSMGISAIVRVTLKDGSFHEDVGYGSIDNAKSKAAAFEKSKKEAVTDATKRALKNFGNSVGACLYDKDYLKKISRMPAPKVSSFGSLMEIVNSSRTLAKPHNLVLENLYRHRDFAAPSGNSHHLPTNTPRTNINNANIPPPSNMPIGQNSIKKEFANVKNEAKNEIEMGDDDMDLLVAADLESIDPRLLAGPSP
ncbi:DNA repair and recombination protein rad22 [Phlyctochytrium arcticum]|nr:DNA repair and recombination protein rad22 [Phlyctochytrium arcticum]